MPKSVCHLHEIWIMMLLCLTIFRTAAADTYRYTDEEGVTCFTDSPTARGAVRISTDRKPDARSFPAIPTHLSATGIATKIGKDSSSIPGSFASPQTPVAGIVTSMPGLRLDPIDGKLRHHEGFDIAVPTGTAVRAALPGKVVFSGERPGYGTMVILEHASGTITIYAHNSANLVAEEQVVDQGAIIALSGSSGRSTGPHLHFEAWKDGNNVTQSFMEGSLPADNSSPRERIVRRIATDGSILFTNSDN